jgi:ankyrin repeat protein
VFVSFYFYFFLQADVNSKDNLGQTCLIIAAKDPKCYLAELLIEHKAQLEARDNHGLTSLMVAASMGSTRVV